MKLADAYPSRYLRAADLGTKRPTLTIKHVSLERIGDDRRLVCQFEESSKMLTLNKSNATTIARLCGSDETSDWHGRQVQLAVVEVDFRGAMVPAIRVVDDTRRPSSPAPDPFGQVVDDDIPF